MPTASYWVVSSDENGNPTCFMWRCDDCLTGMGLSVGEPTVVQQMNDHMATQHPGAEYVAPPIPE